MAHLFLLCAIGLPIGDGTALWTAAIFNVRDIPGWRTVIHKRITPIIILETCARPTSYMRPGSVESGGAHAKYASRSCAISISMSKLSLISDAKGCPPACTILLTLWVINSMNFIRALSAEMEVLKLPFFTLK
ncbi:hypothetical protein BD769DRAFT_1438388, partial [Suillus cothurnatus]